MCPDPQLLSIYLDGELPSPWKEKLENFKRLQYLFKKDTSTNRRYVERVIDEPAEPRTYTADELIEEKKRVWEKIIDKIETNDRFMSKQKNRRYSSSGLWQRRFSIPFPAAAAAAVVITLLTVFWIQSASTGAVMNQYADSGNRENFILASEMEKIEEIPSFAPDADMSAAIQYLTQGGGNIIILQLPESQNFFRSGEPAMIRAADFQQNIPRR